MRISDWSSDVCSSDLAAMIERGRAASCHTILFSSENLEALPFVPEITALTEAAAAEAGIKTIEWHAVLREPGAYFESQHAQLSRHSYADAAHMFSEVMKEGVLFMPEPRSEEHTSELQSLMR